MNMGKKVKIGMAINDIDIVAKPANINDRSHPIANLFQIVVRLTSSL